ncbi:TlpA family protein disulfide reductase [Moheibacter lacus]|uniref:TlpA family protein disulfide reductase n=1 Tax=Moheibacter lacus TaxID=2745851 RepID=A0A838ZR53_9FLAO|nr:TlpA disulfide reductase family protein [Moheibacter lacus]MBA5628752.1 TlpA family protein disulfide reductase [Moheibacter lacus]
MKLNRDQITSVLLVVGLLVLFLTPLGKTIHAKILAFTASDPKLEMTHKNLEPKDWQINLLGYNGFSDTNLEAMKGKVILINFWGTWCGPCVAEMPSMQNLYDAKKKEVNFLFISRGDKPEKIKSFLEKTNYNFPVYEIANKPSKDFIPNTLPTTYVINKNGEIVFVEKGMADWNAPEVHAMLDKLISEN